jgi:hypothetical protein
MPGFMPGIHGFLLPKAWMAPEVGLARLPMMMSCKSGKPDLQ